MWPPTVTPTYVIPTPPATGRQIPEAGRVRGGLAGAVRFELRLGDGAANPYLLQAGILAAGFDGIAERRDPGGARRLPKNLLDALRAFAGSEIVRPGDGRGVLRCLREAPATGVGQLRPPPDAVGAGHDPGCLMAGDESSRRAGPLPYPLPQGEGERAGY